MTAGQRTTRRHSDAVSGGRIGRAAIHGDE
jgi:hypothetical protein